ncbi:hypothetical protein Tco_1049604 [Tanacetum coccineum]
MGVGHYARNYTKKSRVRDSTCYTKRLMMVQTEEARIPLNAEQLDFLAYASDEEQEEGVPNFDNYYDNKIYNLFDQEEQHPKPPESTQYTYVEKHNDSNINFETLNMDFSGEEVEQNAVNTEETNAYFESLLNNFKAELDRCAMDNRETKA